MSRENNTLATAIVNVIPNMSDFVPKLQTQLQTTNLVPLGKEAGEEISRGLKLGLDSGLTVRDWVSSVSSAISVGRFIAPNSFYAVKNLFKGIGATAQGAIAHVRGLSATLNAFSVSNDFGIETAGIAFGKTGRKIAELVASLNMAGSKFIAMANKQGIAAALTAAVKKVWAVATTKLTAAYAKLNIAMMANPKMLALAAIVGLVAGIVWLIDKTIGLQNIWEGLKMVFAPVGDAISAVVGWIQNAVSAIMRNEAVMQGLKVAVMVLLGPLGLLIGVLGSIGSSSREVQAAQENLEQAYERQREAVERLEGASNDLKSAQQGLEDASRGVTMANRRVEDSYDTLQRAIEEHGEGSQEAIRAQEDLEFAMIDYERALGRAEEAQGSLTEAHYEYAEAGYEVENATAAVAEAYDELAEATDALEGKTSLSWESIKSSISNTWTSASEWMSDLGNRAREMWMGSLERTGTTWSGIASGVSGAWSSVSARMSDLRTRAGEMWNGARERASAVWNGVRDRVVGIVSGLPSRLLSIGSDIIQGLVDGISRGKERVASAIRRVTDLIPSTVRNILGIRSPSRVLAALGRDTMRGLIGGLDNLAPALMSTVSGIANDIADMMCLSGTISVAASSYPCGFIAADSLAGAGFSSAVAPQVTYEQNFYTPQANYYDLLAANRAAQKMMARL